MTNQADKPSVEGLMGVIEEFGQACTHRGVRQAKGLPCTEVNTAICAAAVAIRFHAERLASQSAAAPPIVDLSDERAKFEAWAQENNFDIERGASGRMYARLGTNQLFSGWQARAILAASSDEDRKLMEQARDALLGTDPIDPNSAESKAIAALRSRLDGEKK